MFDLGLVYVICLIVLYFMGFFKVFGDLPLYIKIFSAVSLVLAPIGLLFVAHIVGLPASKG